MAGRETTDPQDAAAQLLELTPTRSGLRVHLPPQGDFPSALAQLERVTASGSVRGRAVTVDVGGRSLGASEMRQIETLLLDRAGAALLQVMETGGRESGRSVRRAGGPRAAPTGDTAVAAARRAQRRSLPPPGPPPLARGAQPWAPAADADAEPALLVRRMLRSGQRVRFNGHVVVLGDVNPGAEVVASGDIVVMGTLRGVAHAGAAGSADAIIVAFRLQPTQLRVGTVIGRAPDGQSPRTEWPEVARLRDGALVIERYQPQGAG